MSKLSWKMAARLAWRYPAADRLARGLAPTDFRALQLIALIGLAPIGFFLLPSPSMAGAALWEALRPGSARGLAAAASSLPIALAAAFCSAGIAKSRSEGAAHLAAFASSRSAWGRAAQLACAFVVLPAFWLIPALQRAFDSNSRVASRARAPRATLAAQLAWCCAAGARVAALSLWAAPAAVGMLLSAFMCALMAGLGRSVDVPFETAIAFGALLCAGHGAALLSGGVGAAARLMRESRPPAPREAPARADGAPAWSGAGMLSALSRARARIQAARERAVQALIENGARDGALSAAELSELAGAAVVPERSERPRRI